MKIYIGIDLAWGEKNPSGFAVLGSKGDGVELLDLQLIQSLDIIVQEIQKYLHYDVSIGVDAPLVIPNKEGNRSVEKEFISDFSKYKISMLPVNRTLLSKFSSPIRSEELFAKLTQLQFTRDFHASRTILEVYPHATIAVCFHNTNPY